MMGACIYKYVLAAAVCCFLSVYACAVERGNDVNKSAGVIGLGFDRLPWSFAKQGKYLLVEDPRGLHQIFHPWDTSESGDFATISADFVLPSDWKGSVYLNFYASDTYIAEGWEEVKPTWTHAYASCHNLVGHRFKQVLIQNNVKKGDGALK